MSHPTSIARYEVIGLLGAGGMGAVYQARDPQIGGRLLAIKLLRRDRYATDETETEQLRRRFIQEAHAAGRLQSDHIVQIYDVGTHEGEPFIAMEFIDGETLASIIKRRAPFTLTRKLELMSQLCTGVASAHACGIVHRDIKPLNILVDGRGRLKILDFGIAKMADSGMHTLTGMFMGSCNYVSPEQASGSSALDHRSDIFSIGAVFYELLTCRQAFPGSPPGVLHKIIAQPPEPLGCISSPEAAGLSPVDEELARIITKALEKDPAERQDTVEILLQSVEQARDLLSTTAGLSRPASERPAVQSTSTVDSSSLGLPSVSEPVIDSTVRRPGLLAAASRHLESSDELSPGSLPHDARHARLDTTPATPDVQLLESAFEAASAPGTHSLPADDALPRTDGTAKARSHVEAGRSPATRPLRNTWPRWLSVAAVLVAAVTASVVWFQTGALPHHGFVSLFGPAAGVVVARLQIAESERSGWTGDQFFVTRDSGRTWSQLPMPGATMLGAGGTPESPLVVETVDSRASGARVSILDPQTPSWTTVDGPPEISSVLQQVTSIGQTIFVQTYQNEFYSRSGTASWVLLRPAETAESAPGQIVGGAKAGNHTVLLSNKNFWSFDAGKTWQRRAVFPTPAPSSDSVGIDSVVMHPMHMGSNPIGVRVDALSNHRLWSASYSLEGLGGDTFTGNTEWEPSRLHKTTDQSVYSIARAVEPGALWAIVGDELWFVRAEAMDWNNAGRFSDGYTYVSSLLADPSDPDVVYLGVSYAVLVSRNGVWECHPLTKPGCGDWRPPSGR